jgi:hypothetical protein
MILKFQIIKSVVVDEVKRATYLKAKIDGATDDRAIKMSFNEAAGDEAVHENTLPLILPKYQRVFRCTCEIRQ